jgi:universal stress protein A
MEAPGPLPPPNRQEGVYEMLKPTNILVPTDFSEYSDKALSQALDIAKQYGAKIHVLHVVNEKIRRITDHYSISVDVVKGLTDKLLKGAKKNMERQLAKFPQAKEVTVTTEVVTGVPSEEILRVEEESRADLIVIASLGRTGLAKYLVGGVARNVLKGAKCPVLLTK